MSTHAPESDAATLWRDLRFAVGRRYRLALAVCLAIVLTTFAALYMLTDRYEAMARVLIQLGRENVEVPITVESGVVATSGVRKEDINSHIQLLNSTDLIEQTVTELGMARFEVRRAAPTTLIGRIRFGAKSAVRWFKDGVRTTLVTLRLKADLTERQRLVAGLSKALTVARERESDVISVRLRSADPELAKDFLETLLDVYVQRHMSINDKSIALAVFDQKTEDYRNKLEVLREQTNAIKQSWQLSAPQEQRRRLLERYQGIKRHLDEGASRLAALDQQLRTLQDKLAVLPQETIGSKVIDHNPAMRSIKQRLVELRVKKANATARYVKQAPIVALIDDEIAQLERELAAEDPTQPGAVTWRSNPLHQTLTAQAQQLRIERAGLNAEVATRRDQLALIESDLQRLDVGEGKLEVALLERDVMEQKYRSYAKRREEARIAQLLDEHRIANVKVLSAPSVSPEPVSPRKMLLLSIALFGGVILGIGTALIAHWLDDTVYDAPDLPEPANLTFLGSIRADTSSEPPVTRQGALAESV